MQIRFCEGHTEDGLQFAIHFEVEVDGRLVVCLLSFDTVADQFGGAIEDASETFERHRGQIEPVARNKIRDSEFNGGDGEVLIRNEDLLSARFSANSKQT